MNTFLRLYSNEKRSILVLLRDWVNFCLGFLMAISIMALYTDFLGKEKYIEMLNKEHGWLEGEISIAIYSTLIIICILIFIKNNTFREKKK